MEYEAWFLAAAESLRAYGRARSDATSPSDCEAIRDCKGAVEHLLLRAGEAYSPIADQPSLTALMSLNEARRCASFDKLARDLEGLAR
jgi:hypothetical protein